jgi:glycosyltransferase involved in cell wall biosynthesis
LASRKPRVLFSGFRYTHHSAGGGYDLVAQGSRYVCGNRLPLGNREEHSLTARMNFLITDLVTLARGLSYDVVHYFYPENTAYLSPMLLQLLGKKIVLTVHQHEDVWNASGSFYLKLKQRSFRNADVVIALSREQARVLDRDGTSRSRYIPHGYAFEAGLPSEQEFATRLLAKRVVVAGRNYRDFALLERIIQERTDPTVGFDLLGFAKAERDRFRIYENVITHDFLSDDVYRGMLRASSAVLVPLTFATANNALLEGYNAYLPVLANRVPGVTDYIVDTDKLFDSPAGFWISLNELLSAEPSEYMALCLRCGADARSRFSWSHVRDELEVVYEHLVNHR